jgi:predicted PolB exonuclease-like 3'-5' exonuclease
MQRLFLDIETLPAPPELEPLVREQYARFNDRPTTFEEYHRRTALSGNFGRILCIGYAVNHESAEVLIGDESAQLRQFWQLAADFDQFIGHHILEFDLPFIIKRSIVHRVKPTKELSFSRHQSVPIFDTKKEWDSWSNTPATSLDTLAKLFGFQTSKQGIDGSQVYDFWQAGRFQEIYDYCKRDVELTRKIYHRLTFSEAEDGQETH